MSVIIEVLVPASDFELGRLLDVRAETSVELEAVVPAGTGVVPLLWAYGPERETLGDRIADHHAAESVRRVEDLADRSLYRVQWVPDFDSFLTATVAHDAAIVTGSGTRDSWQFELRFPGHEPLASFQSTCSDLDIEVDVRRMYDPAAETENAWYGLTDAQYEALSLAVEEGYFEIPREISLHGLAEELGLSDQATSERIRRAVRQLSTNTLFGDAR